MNLASGAPPIFLTKNYVNRDVVDGAGVFTVSSMDAIKERILDMDPYAYWQGANADDAVSEVVDIALYDGAAQVVRSLDFLALLNINFKSFTVELSDDGGTSFHTTYTETDYALSYWVKDLSAAAKDANYIRITANTTQTANSYKKLGTVVAAGLLKQMPEPPSTPIDRNEVETAIALTMSDGSKDISYIRRSDASFTFYQASLNFRYVPAADLRELQELRRENPVFLLYPEPGDKQDEVFYCRFSTPLKIKYSSEYKGAGHDLAFGVEEIG